MEIIDSQVHVWGPNTPERPWLAGREKDVDRPPLGYEELRGLMNQAGVDRAILVPRSFDGDRNDLVLEAAQAYPDRFGVMGRIAIERPEAQAALPRLLDQPGMLGLRLTFHRGEEAAWLEDGTADWFWPAAERYEVPVMVHAPKGLEQMGEIARRHPGLRIIYDHMGFARSTVDDKTVEAAKRMADLAVHPNIHVKVSALPLFSTHPYPFRNLDIALRRVIEAFGPQRSFWGTDLSQYMERFSYADMVAHFTEHLDFLTPDDLEWIMGRGLKQCLNWR